MHRRRADLHAARAQHDEFRGIAPRGNAADAGDRQTRRFNVACNFGHHVQRNRLDGRATVAAVRTLAVDDRHGRHHIQIHADDRVDGVDQRHAIRTTLVGRSRTHADIADVRREFHEAWQLRALFDPARDHLYVLGHLAYRRAHATLAHAVWATEVQLDRIGAGVFDERQDPFPVAFVARHHQRDDQRAIRPVALDLGDLAQVDVKRPVGDQFDIVQACDALAVPLHRAVARADIDHVRVEAQGFPDHSAPACFEGAVDVIGFIGRRCGREPERVRRRDAGNRTAQIGHVRLLGTLFYLDVGCLAWARRARYSLGGLDRRASKVSIDAGCRQLAVLHRLHGQIDAARRGTIAACPDIRQ